MESAFVGSINNLTNCVTCLSAQVPREIPFQAAAQGNSVACIGARSQALSASGFFLSFPHVQYMPT